MDNCSGQGKNGTLLKMGAYLVACGWLKKINFIFLVKGHTQNICKRMFNLLKVKLYRSIISSMDQALEVLNTVENVSTIKASNIHLGFSTFLNWWYKQPTS